jgi:hypothetical protein
MVQVPRAISEGTLTTTTTAPLIGDVDSFTQTAKALQQTGAVLKNISQDFKELDTLRSVSKATVATSQQLSELENRLLTDPNLTESFSVQYEREATKIINNQLSTIGDERARMRAGVSFQGNSLIKGFNVKKQGRERDVKNFIEEKAEVAKDSLETAYKADEKERPLLRENYKVYLSENLGYSDVGALQKDLDDYDEALRIGRAPFQRQALTSAAPGKSEQERILGAQIFLEQMKSGKYSELTSDEQEAEVKKANNFIARQSKIAEDNMKANQRAKQQEEVNDVIDGKFSEKEIREKGLREEWGGTFVTNALAYNTSDKAPPTVTDMGEYVRIRRMQLGQVKKEDGTVFTQDEAINETVSIANDSLTAGDSKTLVEKSFNVIDKKEDATYKAEFENLESRMKVIRLNQFNATTTENIFETPAEIQQQINTFIYTFDRRVAAIENPSEEQIKQIADDVFEQWKTTPQSEGGAGLPKGSDVVTFGINGLIKRLTGEEENSDSTPATVDLRTKKKKK